jgi:hypothetical protein
MTRAEYRLVSPIALRNALAAPARNAIEKPNMLKYAFIAYGYWGTETWFVCFNTAKDRAWRGRRTRSPPTATKPPAS